MIRNELNLILQANPFEPFRIKLVNGDTHDVFDAQSVALQTATVWIVLRDGGWVAFPIDKINSVESLLDDFQGQGATPSE